MASPAVSSAKRPREKAMESSTGSLEWISATTQPGGLRKGSLLSGRVPKVVVSAIGSDAVPSPRRATSTRALTRSQVRVASAAPPEVPKLAVERALTRPQRQVPGVCAASRQSAGGDGVGVERTGAGAGGGGGGAAGMGLCGAAQDASIRPRPSAAGRREGAIAFTRLLWKEARR